MLRNIRWLGMICSAIISALGGWDAGLHTLIALMAVDYFSGLLVAGVFKQSKKSITGALSSIAGFRGLIKKGMCLALVYVSHRLDVALDIGFVRNAVVFALIANELISIIENAGLMGIPCPPMLRKALDILRDKEDADTEG